MSIIKNDDNIKSPDIRKKSIYELPAVVREDKDEISFKRALIIALIFHPIVFLIILVSSFVLKLLGIDFDLFKKPPLVPKDIEFVLVEKEGQPINKNTKNRADKNSQAGGKHDPTKRVSPQQEEVPQGPKEKPAPQKVIEKKPEVKKQQEPKQQVQKPTPAPKPKAPKPTVTPSAPKPTAKPSSNFNIPIPKSIIPQIAQPTTAPVTTAPKIGGNAAGTKSGSAAPSFSPTSSSANSRKGSVQGGGGRFSDANGTGRANIGNPDAGNPNGPTGIDAIKSADFAPYMNELQRRIKMNWDPPSGNESRRVVLLFSIARDGRLLNVKIHRSSGVQAADNAAVEAVKLSAPFRPLPPEYKDSSVDILFTFDYNVLGISY